MAQPERLPVALHTRREARRIFTRGKQFDFINWDTVDTVQYQTDFYGHAFDPFITTGGQGTAPAISNNALNGEAALVTTATGQRSSILYLDNGNVQANQNPVLECRVKVSSIADGLVQIGYTDSAAAGVLGATGLGPFVSPLTATPTMVGATANACAWVYDMSSALANPSFWRFAYVRAGTAATFLPTSTVPALQAPVAGTYQWLTMQLERSPVAVANVGVNLWVNHIYVGTVSTAVISNTAPLYPFVLIQSTTTNSRTLTIDYLGVWWDRDTTA